MNTKLNLGPMVCGSFAAALLAFACSTDKVESPTPEGGIGGFGNETGTGGASAGNGGAGKSGGSGGEGGTGGVKGSGGAGGGKATGGAPGTDGGDGGTKAVSLCAGKTGQAQLDCGEYIVRHIEACGDCHSPINPATGGPSQDPTKFLTGNPSFADLDPTNAAVGNIPTPNLTVLKSELWTASDVKDAFLNGKRPDARGGGLFPIMPYFILHNMAPEDADAIAAFILNLTPEGTQQPGRQTLPPGPTLPIPVLLAKILPDPVAPAGHQDEAMLGKYIAGQIGPCVDCHTPRTPAGNFDQTRLFAGGDTFAIGGPFGVVTSLNITPANNGIKGWTPEDVRTLILTGVDKDGVHICPPMPAGPFGAFGGMDPAQALAIGYYLTSIPGIENPEDGGRIMMCVPPPPPPTDAGTTSDASKG